MILLGRDARPSPFSRPPEMELVGDYGGRTVPVLQVHLDDGDPYFTVRMPDGSERQTDRLSRVRVGKL